MPQDTNTKQPLRLLLRGKVLQGIYNFSSTLDAKQNNNCKSISNTKYFHHYLEKKCKFPSRIKHFELTELGHCSLRLLVNRLSDSYHIQMFLEINEVSWFQFSFPTQQLLVVSISISIPWYTSLMKNSSLKIQFCNSIL